MAQIYQSFEMKPGDSAQQRITNLYLGIISVGEDLYCKGSAVAELNKEFARLERVINDMRKELAEIKRDGLESGAGQVKGEGQNEGTAKDSQDLVESDRNHGVLANRSSSNGRDSRLDAEGAPICDADDVLVSVHDGPANNNHLPDGGAGQVSTAASAEKFLGEVAKVGAMGKKAVSARKIYKWQASPDICPECDSPCFITAGGMDLTCYHCFLSEGWDKSSARVGELEKQIAGYKSALREAIAQRDEERGRKVEAGERAEKAEQALLDIRKIRQTIGTNGPIERSLMRKLLDEALKPVS